MKLTYDPQIDKKQLKSLIQFLLQSRKGETMTGLKAQKMFREFYGLDINHHEYSKMLDYLASIEGAEVVGHNSDGMTIYLIN